MAGELASCPELTPNSAIGLLRCKRGHKGAKRAIGSFAGKYPKRVKEPASARIEWHEAYLQRKSRCSISRR